MRISWRLAHAKAGDDGEQGRFVGSVVAQWGWLAQSLRREWSEMRLRPGALYVIPRSQGFILWEVTEEF